MKTKHSLGGRTYYVCSPAKSAPRSRALVVMLHGGMGNAKVIESGTGMTEIATRERFFVAYPEGTGTPQKPNNRTWNAGGGCCGAAAKLKVDDIGFLSNMIDKIVEENPAVDPARVYAMGMSNGAMMGYRLANEAPNKIAAVVAVAAALTIPDATGMADIPVLHIHGDADPNIPYLGGVGDGPSGIKYISVMDTMRLLLAPRGKSKKVEVPGKDRSRTSWTCTNGAPVELNTVHGGKHAWPAWASEEAWAFASVYQKD